MSKKPKHSGGIRRLFIFKYMMISTGITFSSFLILFTVFIFMVRGYVASESRDHVESATRQSAEFVEMFVRRSDTGDLSEALETRGAELAVSLEVVSSCYDNMDVMVVDNDGNILLRVIDGKTDNTVGIYIPRTVMDSLAAGAGSVDETLDSFFESPHLVSALPMLTDDGHVLGTVFAAAPKNIAPYIGNHIVKIFLLAILWVIIISSVVFYILLSYVADPLKSLSNAAESVAKSDYTQHVIVKGNDEITLLAESFNLMVERLKEIDKIMRTAVTEFSKGDYSSRIPVSDGELVPLADAFNEMADKIQKLDDMRTDFIASVSHDLRSPMTSIIGYVDLIREGNLSAEEETKYLAIVRDECMRLSGLVQQLIELTRYQTGDRKIEMAPFDICETARIIILSLAGKIEAKDLDVDIDFDDDNIIALGDKDSIHRVLYNICDNAIKFAYDRGKYSISIKYDGEDKNKVRVSVFDEGKGISPDNIGMIFERFYKEDKCRGAEKVSSGLGLYISKLIMDRHGQKIEAESEYLKWFRITFTLAVAPVGTVFKDNYTGNGIQS